MTTVRFFAAAEEAVGADRLERSEPSVGALREALIAEHPALRTLLPRCALLVDGARVDDAHPLGDGTLVDVLPPFAGG